jgi:hypothetical protein
VGPSGGASTAEADAPPGLLAIGLTDVLDLYGSAGMKSDLNTDLSGPAGRP